MTFYTFANATTSIPLANLDANFATPITLGNTAVTINGTFSSIGNLTLNNATIASGTVSVTSISTGSVSNSGNETFTGTGARVLGDFTNATVTNRLAFQTSTANSTTGIYALPSGTSTAASWQATNAADPTNASKILIATNGSTDVQLVSGINGTGTYLPLSFYTNGAQKMQLDTSGNLGLGVSPSAWSALTPALQVGGGGGFVASQGNTPALYIGTNAYYNGTNWIYKTTQAASYYQQYQGVHSWSYAASGTAGNTITFSESMRIDSSGNVGIGRTPSSKLDVAGQINGSPIYIASAAATSTFYYDSALLLTQAGTGERARIDSSGNLLVGTTTNVGKLSVVASSNLGAGYTQYLRNTWSGDLSYPGLYLAKYDNNTTTSQIFVRFSVNNELTASGQINANGANSAAFGSFSDRRLKENIVDLPSQLANICSLRPVEFDYKDGSGHQIGFIAQEIQEVYSDVVATGENEMLTVTGWSKTEARLVKAIQELKAEFDAYKASHP